LLLLLLRLLLRLRLLLLLLLLLTWRSNRHLGRGELSWSLREALAWWRIPSWRGAIGHIRESRSWRVTRVSKALSVRWIVALELRLLRIARRGLARKLRLLRWLRIWRALRRAWSRHTLSELVSTDRHLVKRGSRHREVNKIIIRRKATEISTLIFLRIQNRSVNLHPQYFII